MSSSDSPYFSVVIPLYNKRPHIERAVNSVLSQSFDNFEILVIDDASTDGGPGIVSGIGDDRIKLFKRDTPGPGGYAARNLGIRKASGRYIAFLDADDRWNPDHLEKYHDLSVKFPDEEFFGCGWIIKEPGYEYTDPYYENMKSRGDHVISVYDYLKSVLAGMRPVHTSISCVRRNSFVISGLFPEEKKARRGGDLHAWLKLVCRYGSMAWSSHIGGVYYKDAVNMVTRTAPSSTYLLGRDVYAELAGGLDIREKVLLKKYFNRRLKNSWTGNRNRKIKSFFLPAKLFWKGDFFNAVKFSLRSFIPGPVVVLLRKLKNSVKRRDYEQT